MKTLSQNWVVAALAATWLAAQNVGIGTTTPLTRLHVAEGDIFLGEVAGANGFVLHSRSSAGYDYFQISTRTGGTYEWSKGITLVRSSGNVGIGTTGPEGSLDVARGAGEAQANATSGSLPYGTEKADLILERLHSPTRSLNGYPASLIDFRARNTFGSIWSVAQILGVVDLNVSGGYAGGLAFLTSAGGFVDPAGRRTTGSAPVTRMVIDANGNVGIGTTAPHPAAILQLQATNKGFLPTQVALTSATSWSPLVGTSVDGMLVYNTATAGSGANAVSPGYYYWRAGRWRRFSENPYAGMIQGVLHTGHQNLTAIDPQWQYLNSYIDLPPGKWIVHSVQILHTGVIGTSGSIWVRTQFSESPSNCATRTADYIGSYFISGLLPNSAEYGLVIGQVIINNTSGNTKRYYYCGHKDPTGNYNEDLVDFSTIHWNENQLYALPGN